MNIPLLQNFFRAALGAGVAIVLVTSQTGAAAGSSTLAGPMLLLLAGGVISGFLAGLLGIGGALITVPVFYLALPGLGVPPDVLPQAVVASSLASMLPTTIAGIRSHARHGTIDWAMLRDMSPRMVFGATLGALLAMALRGPVLALAFAAQALYYGGRLVSGGVRGGPPGRVARASLALPRWVVVPSISGFCACVGMGGGSMVVPYLIARGQSLHRAVATGSALNLCIALGGSVVFLAIAALSPGPAGLVCWPAALAVGVLAILTVPWGVSLAQRLPSARLAFLVGLINVAGGLSLVAQVAHVAQVTAPPAAAVGPTAAPRIAAIEAEWQRTALNALLVPLLDDDLPVNWAAPTSLTPCTEHSTVSVDGAPIPYGSRVARGPFVMRWKLVDCWPLGFDAWGLDGELEMTVAVGADRIFAQVHPRGLTARTMQGRQPLTQPFQGKLWLVAPPRQD